LRSIRSFVWLGPHKGVVHLAQASLTNACFDLWAKSRGVPLWRLLLDLDPARIVDLLDLSYLEEVLTRDEAETMLLTKRVPARIGRTSYAAGIPDTTHLWVGSSTKTSK
jgi:L-fuconate dehydratase